MQSFASTVVVSGQHIFYCSIRLVGPHSDGRFPSPLVGLHAEPTGHNSFPFGSGGGGVRRFPNDCELRCGRLSRTWRPGHVCRYPKTIDCAGKRGKKIKNSKIVIVCRRDDGAFGGGGDREEYTRPTKCFRTRQTYPGHRRGALNYRYDKNAYLSN